MNWDAIGAIGEILGAIAVFVSLAYLAIQIKTNSSIGMASIQQQAFDAHAKGLESLVENPQLSSCIRKLRSGEKLTEQENSEIDPFLRWVMDSHQNNYVQYSLGFLDQQSFEAQRNRIANLFYHEPGVQWIMRNADEYRPDLVNEVHEHIRTEKGGDTALMKILDPRIDT